MKIATELASLFSEMRLTAIAEHYISFRKEAESNGTSYDEFILQLLRLELAFKKECKVLRLLAQSHLPAGKTLENFDEKRLPTTVQRKFKSLLDGDFLSRKENVLVFGKPGSGKSHLVCAIAHELVRKGYRMLFTTAQMLVQDLLIAKRDLWLKKQIKRLSGFDGIVIDDLGYVQQSREEMEVLFTLLAERYETGSLLLTSNLPFSKWEIIFKDPMTTAAAIDRLVHHSLIIELNLQSYRMEEAKSKKSNGE